ncbi:hypothetical protein JB92DRAFT_3100398 [Gautieria morchelliformis]|nr:hypothetical protein JB92DRAFT_3100398 [Gautieria morchelliformis]
MPEKDSCLVNGGCEFLRAGHVAALDRAKTSVAVINDVHDELPSAVQLVLGNHHTSWTLNMLTRSTRTGIHLPCTTRSTLTEQWPQLLRSSVELAALWFTWTGEDFDGVAESGTTHTTIRRQHDRSAIPGHRQVMRYFAKMDADGKTKIQLGDNTNKVD